MKKTTLILAVLVMAILPCAADNNDAIIAAEVALGKAEASGDRHEIIKQMARCGNAWFDAGNFEKARDYCCKAFNLMQDKADISLNQSSYTISNSLFTISRIYNKNGQPDEALRYLDQSLDFEKSLKRNTLICRRYEDKAAILIETGRYTEALECISEMRTYFNNPNFSFYHIPQLHYLEGLCYEGIGDKVKAEEAFTESLQEVYKNKHFQGHVSVPLYFSKVADYRLAAGDTATARDMYNRARDIIESHNYKIHAFKIYGGLSRIYAASDTAASAEYCRKAHEFDYITELDNLSSKIAIHSIDFPRREREQLIRNQKMQIITFISLAALLLALLILAMYHIRNLKRQAEARVAQNEALQQSLQRKNELLALAQGIQDEKISSGVREIANQLGADTRLTRREMEIAKLITEGLLNKEIAYKLNISVRTVENHRNSIYKKLGVSNSAELIKILSHIA